MRTKLEHFKEKAIKLRLAGNSYGYIKKTLGLKSKGTISYWLKNVVIPKESKKKLEKNNLLATKRGLFVFNKQRTERIKEENKQAYIKGVESVPKNLNKRDLLMVGIALYWAEGTKAGGDKPSPRFSFSNSDPKMVLACIRFITEVLKINEENISGGIHIYPNTDVEKAREFWSKITNIPNKKLYIVTQISRASQGIRENRLPYGTVHIRITKRLVFFRMKGMIDGMIQKLNIK